MSAAGCHCFDLQGEHGNSPLIRAITNGHLNIAKCLTEAHVDVNLQNERGATPLLSASVSGHMDSWTCKVSNRNKLAMQMLICRLNMVLFNFLGAVRNSKISNTG